MMILVLILVCFIFSIEDQKQGFQYTASLSNNGKGEKGYEYFLKNIIDKIEDLSIENPIKEEMETSGFIIIGLSPDIILNFIKNKLPFIIENKDCEYFISYINSINNIQEVNDNYNKIDFMIDILEVVLDGKNSSNEDYETEIRSRKFRIKNKKINRNFSSEEIKVKAPTEYVNNEHTNYKEVIMTENLYDVIGLRESEIYPDFFVINDEQISKNNFKLLSETLKIKLEKKKLNTRKFFQNSFRSFYKDENDLFSLISNIFFDENSFLRKEFIENIFKIKYHHLKDIIYESFGLYKFEDMNYKFPESLEDTISTKEKFIQVLEQYIKEENWSNFINELKNIYDSIDKNKDYLIISTSSDLGHEIKNHFQQTLKNYYSVDFLIELHFFRYKLRGEVKIRYEEDFLFHTIEDQINTLIASPLEKKQEIENGILIEWTQVEFKEYDQDENNDKYIIIDDDISKKFAVIKFKNFILKIFVFKKTMKFELQSKLARFKSYKFEVVLNIDKFYEFTLSLYTDENKNVVLYGLDPQTWILTLIEKFLYERPNKILEFRALKSGELFNACNYYQGYEEDRIGKFKRKFDFIDRTDFLEKIAKSFNLINFEDFSLNPNLMMTNRGFVFENYTFQDMILKSNSKFFNDNEVVSFINKDNSIDSKSMKMGMRFEIISIVDFILTFNDLKSDCERKLILRVKCQEFLEDNRIIKFINNLFEKGFVFLKKQNKKTLLRDFLSNASKKNICTSSYGSSYEISKLLYDKEVPLKRKIEDIIQISIKSLFIENYDTFISERNLGGRLERDVKKLLQISIVDYIVPEIDKNIKKELEKSNLENLLESKKGSSVFELSVFYQPSKKDIKNKSKRIKSLLSKMTEWAKKLK